MLGLKEYVQLVSFVIIAGGLSSLCLNESSHKEDNITSYHLTNNLAQPITTSSHFCSNVTVSEYYISRDVFGRHNAWERPLVNGKKPINVEIRLVLSSINDVIEKEKILKLTGYLLLNWWDEFHVWNSTFPHACLPSVVLPRHEVWIPEIAMINSERHYELLLMHDEEMVQVSSDGYVSYRPGGTFQVYCDYDMTYFPFDKQVCALTMESWRYTIEYQTFSFGESIERFYWMENEQWLLLNTSQLMYNFQDTVLNDTFPRIEFGLVLQRKVGYYLINIIIPSIIISVTEVTTFALPVDEVLKIHISFTCLLAYGVFQLMIIEGVPRTSDKIPLLSYYITLSMVYICLAMLGEGLVFVCIRKGNDKHHKHEVPNFLYDSASVVGKALFVKKPLDLVNIGHSLLKAFLGYSSLSENENKDKFGHGYVSLVHRNGHKTKEQLRKEAEFETQKEKRAESVRRQRWEFLADVVDRFVLINYVFLIFLTPIAMFIIVPACS